MTEILIKREKTVAFSGHRSLGKDFNKLALCNEIIRLIETGYDTFLVGMAVGFDTECFKILEKISTIKIHITMKKSRPRWLLWSILKNI